MPLVKFSYYIFYLGGTIDITVHETNHDGTVKELYKANGGPWGGSYVDEKYAQLLCQIFGEMFIRSFKSKFPHQWLDMMIDFEKRKRASSPQSDKFTNIPLHMGFVKQFEKFTRKEFESLFKVDPSLGVKFSSDGALRISSTKMAEMFGGVLKNVKDHLKDLLQKPAVKGVNYIFLVGGFGESVYMQELVKEVFGRSCTVLIPEDASLCILKGAVMYGHNLSAIYSRISKVSYAVETYRTFRDYELLHLEPLVRVGEDLPLDTIRSKNLIPLKPDQTEIELSLYSSKDTIHSTESYPDDDNVVHLSSITVHSPDISRGRDRNIKVSITFGGTEMYYQAVDEVSGNKGATSVSYDI